VRGCTPQYPFFSTPSPSLCRFGVPYALDAGCLQLHDAGGGDERWCGEGAGGPVLGRCARVNPSRQRNARQVTTLIRDLTARFRAPRISKKPQYVYFSPPSRILEDKPKEIEIYFLSLSGHPEGTRPKGAKVTRDARFLKGEGGCTSCKGDFLLSGDDDDARF
jgi:hypothetical protein